MYTCPVCAYTELEFPPQDFSICACCGTEFGYDDRALSHHELTEKWVALGCLWFDSEEQKPFGWNAYLQLLNGGMRWALPRFYGEGRTESVFTVNERRAGLSGQLVELVATTC